MGLLIFVALMMILAVVMLIAFFKVVGAAFDVVCGLGRLLWAIGSLMDRVFVRTLSDYEADQRLEASLPPPPAPPQQSPGLRLVANNERRA